MYFIHLQHIEQDYGKVLTDKEDIQQLRLEIESAKIQLTTVPVTNIDLNLRSLGKIHYRVIIIRLQGFKILFKNQTSKHFSKEK